VVARLGVLLDVGDVLGLEFAALFGATVAIHRLQVDLANVLLRRVRLFRRWGRCGGWSGRANSGEIFFAAKGRVIFRLSRTIHWLKQVS